MAIIRETGAGPDWDSDGVELTPDDDIDLDDDLDERALVERDLVERDLDEYDRAVIARWTPGPEHGLPKAITVGGTTYEVRVFEPRDDDVWDGPAGVLYTDDKTISVKRGGGAEEWRDTLLHEVLHAVDHAAGTDAGETVVNAWAPVLLDALRSNPELVVLLLADDGQT